MRRFGYLYDLVLALRVHGVPLDALSLTYFTEEEQAWIRLGYEVDLHQLGETVDA